MTRRRSWNEAPGAVAADECWASTRCEDRLTVVDIADGEAAAGGKHPVFCHQAGAGAADDGWIIAAVDRDGDGFTVGAVKRLLTVRKSVSAASSCQRLNSRVGLVEAVAPEADLRSKVKVP